MGIRMGRRARRCVGEVVKVRVLVQLLSSVAPNRKRSATDSRPLQPLVGVVLKMVSAIIFTTTAMRLEIIHSGRDGGSW